LQKTRFFLKKRVQKKSLTSLVLGKTLNAVTHLEAKQSTCCGGQAWRKTCK